MPFTNPIRCKMVRGAGTHLKALVVTLFLVPDFGVGDTDVQLDELNVMGFIEPQSSWLAALPYQRQGEVQAKQCL